MRAKVIVMSITSAVCVVLLGGLLNAITGLPLDISPAYNAPIRVVSTLLGAAPGFILGLIGLGYALYDAARRGGVGWFSVLLVWPFVPLTAAGLMFSGVFAYATLWLLALAFVPLAALMYALTAPSTSGTLGGIARSRLVVFVSVLLLVALGSTALLLSGRQGGSTVVPGPPALQVTQSGSQADCARGTYPAITLTNTGKQALKWAAKSQDPNVTAVPVSGSLAPGTSITVSLTGATQAPDVIVQFQSGGQTAGTAKFGCQAGASG